MKQQKRMDGYADRLAVALQRGPRPMSVRGLANVMGKEYEGLRGTSYGGIRQYAENKVLNPRIELLRAIADLLGVRWQWLAFNEGEMTEEEQRARDLEEEALSRDVEEKGMNLLEAALSAVREGFGKDGERLAAAGIRRAAILHTWRRLVSGQDGRAGFRDGSSLAHRLGQALGGPLRDLDVDPASIPDDSLTDYTLMATAALRHLYPEPWQHSRRGARSTAESDAEA